MEGVSHTVAQKVPAKRRVVPVLVSAASPSNQHGGSPTKSANTTPLRTAAATDPNEEPGLSSKKRARDFFELYVHIAVSLRSLQRLTIVSDWIFAKRLPEEHIKRSKGASGQVVASPSSLEPFYFLVTSPPKYWASAYENLSQWMQKAINNDWTDEPERLQIPEDLLAPTCPTHSQWRTLLSELEHLDRISILWSKFTIVDKIVTLFGDDHWNERNMGFFALQHRVWWVSAVQPWFAVSQVRTCQEYLQISLSALVLELWFRFVWARYTESAYLAKAPKLAASEVVPLSPNSQTDSGDDILEPSELGEGSSDSESESNVDSSFDDTADENELGSLHESTFFGTTTSNKMDMTAEDDEEDSTDDSSKPSDSLPRTAEGGLVSEHAYEQETNASMSVDQNGAWLDEIPFATSLFFAHPRILQACEVIEQQYWSTGVWNCLPAFERLLQLTLDRNADLQLPEQSNSQVEPQIEYAYNKIMAPFLQNIGILTEKAQIDETMAKNTTLESLPLMWSFNPSFGGYWVDTILRGMFSNLSNCGIAPAVHFIGLFPHLLLLSDSKADAQVSRVYQEAHAKLVSKGVITPQLEALIATLDSLTLEKTTLIRQNQKYLRLHRAAAVASRDKSGSDVDQDQEDPEAMPSDLPTNTVEGRLHSQRISRIKQIDVMIAEINVELNHLTGGIDRVESKRRRQTKGEGALAMSNFLPSAEASAPQPLPSDADLWGIPSLTPPQ